MNYRLIPNTDLRVSTICLGTMLFGTPVPAADAIQLVHWAMDHGVNFFDTADMYEGYTRVIGSPGGVSEEILGQALADRRDRAIVTTKVGSVVGSQKDDQGLGRTHMLRQIDASLRRLQTDHVDIYEMHRPDPHTPLEESIGVMAELIAAGKVRHWGFSNYAAAQISEMIQICDRNVWPRPAVSQPPYSWLNREIEREHLPVCREREIAVTPYQPLQGGLLSGKYRRGQPLPQNSRAAEQARWLEQPDDAMFDRLESFEAEAAGRGLRPEQYAIRWLLDRPGIPSVIVGVKRIAQLESLLAGA